LGLLRSFYFWSTLASVVQKYGTSCEGMEAGWQGVRLSGLGPVVGPVLKWQGLGLEALSLLDIVWF